MSGRKPSEDQRALWRSRIRPFSPNTTSAESPKRSTVPPQTCTSVLPQSRTAVAPKTGKRAAPRTAPPSNSFGQRLRTLRKRKKLSQVELARQIRERSGRPMSQANVSHLERRLDAPRQDLLNLLADFFGVPSEHFYRQLDADWPARRERVAAYLESLQHRVFIEGCRPPPLNGKCYTIYDNWWFHVGYALED